MEIYVLITTGDNVLEWEHTAHKTREGAIRELATFCLNADDTLFGENEEVIEKYYASHPMESYYIGRIDTDNLME